LNDEHCHYQALMAEEHPNNHIQQRYSSKITSTRTTLNLDRNQCSVYGVNMRPIWPYIGKKSKKYFVTLFMGHSVYILKEKNDFVNQHILVLRIEIVVS
jgi:hypothetical protein